AGPLQRRAGSDRDLACEALLEWRIRERRRRAPDDVIGPVVERQIALWPVHLSEELLLVGKLVGVELVGVLIDRPDDDGPVDVAQRRQHGEVALWTLRGNKEEVEADGGGLHAGDRAQHFGM